MPAEKYEDCSFYQIKNRDLPGTAKCNGGEGMPDECKIRETCPFYKAFKAQGPWWENIPVNPERDEKILEQLERKEKEEERMRNEMMGKPINLSGRFKSIDALRQLEEKAQAMTTEDMELAAAALINQDVPLTAEERSEKYPMIPTRIDTKAGAWEMFGEYKGDETLVGYTMRYDHGATPFKDSLRIVMTVEEWQKVCEQLDEVLRMMKL